MGWIVALLGIGISGSLGGPPQQEFKGGSEGLGMLFASMNQHVP
jgi:hypothetical protein